jgi:hypothetical protein
VGEPSTHLFERYRRERLGDRLDQRFARARSDLPEDVLYLRERLLYGVRIRRVGGQEQKVGTPGLNELSDLLGPVCPEIVEQHHSPFGERRPKEVLDVSLEGFGVGGALDDHRRAHRSFEGDACHQRGVDRRRAETRRRIPGVSPFQVPQGPLVLLGAYLAVGQPAAQYLFRRVRS